MISYRTSCFTCNLLDRFSLASCGNTTAIGIAELWQPNRTVLVKLWQYYMHWHRRVRNQVLVYTFWCTIKKATTVIIQSHSPPWYFLTAKWSGTQATLIQNETGSCTHAILTVKCNLTVHKWFHNLDGFKLLMEAELVTGPKRL
jgi:hypothetical protein